MLKVIIPLGIVGAGLMIYSLIECIQTPRHRVRVLGKSAWLAVIVLVPIIGAGLWLAFGRGRVAAPGAAPKKGPAAPDDDPNFLRNLEIQRMQKQREEELRRKEAELDARDLDAREKDEPQKKPDDGAAPAAGNGHGEGHTGEGRPGNGRPAQPEDGAGDAAEDTDVDDPRSN